MDRDSPRTDEPNESAPGARRTVFVSNVQRFCVHDGPGIRTVVFLLGCPLRCAWCQNPETLARTPVLMFNPGKCTGCAACVEACEIRTTFQGSDGKIRFDRSRCTACGKCVVTCYYRARELSARSYTVRALLEAIGRDSVVYRNSGGGVTLSGGEPLIHPAFVGELFRGCRSRGIHAAIETCGAVPWSSFERVLAHTDLFLYDIKLVDRSKHEQWTGVSNHSILENAIALAERGARIIVRVPLIHGVNDDDEEFLRIARFSASLRGVDEMHMLPFHQVGSPKYELVGVEYAMGDVVEDNAERVARCRQIAEDCGLRVSVGGSGVRSEKDAERVRRESRRKKDTFLYEI
jgi:pyruvate formate lyase activating enzyme